MVEQRIRVNDAEPIGVLNPEQDEGDEKLFSPRGEDLLQKENGTDRPASKLNAGRRQRGGEVPINPDVQEERRRGRT
ncbi:hypothetical protein NDU88_001938 [Pleurodeles waltl]|uniref:Uncharacterized protein n=1 Tax=Pleurodeles waltl TaxID=8319 RepID=A0AAV7V971_PLEWA|nr:hypothetical protein NDU88_001938 [Pleurodeles waltl]